MFIAHCVRQSLELWSCSTYSERSLHHLSKYISTLFSVLSFCHCSVFIRFLKFTAVQCSLSMEGLSLFVCLVSESSLSELDSPASVLVGFPLKSSLDLETVTRLPCLLWITFLQFQYVHSRVRLLLNNSRGRNFRVSILCHMYLSRGLWRPT